MQMSRSKLPCRQVWVNWINLKGQSISCAFILGIFLPGKKMYVFRALHSLFFVLEISSIFPCIIGTGESRSCLESSCDLLGKIHQNNFLFLPYTFSSGHLYVWCRQYTVVENWKKGVFLMSFDNTALPHTARSDTVFSHIYLLVR